MSDKTWDEYFMDIVKIVGSKSKDPSIKIGCIVVGPDKEIRATGFNGFPRGVNDIDNKRYERPDKYFYTEHAERNCIYHAARIGSSLKGCTMYVSAFPCHDCARAIIQAGIKEIVYTPWEEDTRRKNQWEESFKKANEMFEETGTILRVYGGTDGSEKGEEERGNVSGL